MISASRDGTIQSWLVKANEGRTVLAGAGAQVQGIVHDKSGRLMVTACADGHVRVWSVAGRNELFGVTVRDPDLNTIAVHPSGSLVAVASDNVVNLWTVETGKLRSSLEGHERRVDGVAFNTSGTTLASASEDAVKLWSVIDGSEIKKLSAGIGGRCVRFSPDNTMLAIGSGGGTLKLYDIAMDRETHTVTHAWGGYSLAFTPDGTRVVADSAEGVLKLWSVATGQEEKTLKAHTQRVYSLSFSPDGRLLVSVDVGGNLLFWDLADGASLPINAALEITDARCAMFSPCGRYLAVGCKDGRTEVFESEYPAVENAPAPAPAPEEE